MTDRGRTSLTAYAPLMRDPDPDGAHKLAARKWHEDGTLIVRPASIAAWTGRTANC
jgi:hypothetical protein